LLTECNQETFSFAAHFSRRVEAGFSAGQVSSDGGSLLLREADRRIGLLGRLAGCFSDRRMPLLVTHQLPEMLAQRIYGLALGYEDLNDHEQLRSDPLLAVLSGKRKLEEPLAGKSTLNRLELTGRSTRYHKIGYSSDVRRLSKVELLERLDPGQVRLLHPQLDRASFPIFHLRLEQSFEIVQMRVLALGGLFGERGELRPDGWQSQRLTALSDTCDLEAHACTACNSRSYSIMVGRGRSYAHSAPISIGSPTVCCN
jgi:hypothetical protein